jgi:hypothetical protein
VAAHQEKLVPTELAMELQVVPAMRHKMGVVLPLYRMCKLKWSLMLTACL